MVARFIYIADTHLGARPMGYQMQQGHPERIAEILQALEGFIGETGGIDFVLHGGDMVDAATEANIRSAADTFQLSVPVYLCLGNHDLTDERSLGMWQSLAPTFFPGGRPEFTIQAGPGAVHVVPNHWEAERPYFWGDRQDAQFSPDQLDWLRRAGAAATESVTVVATHCPALGLPPEQTGFDEAYHSPPPGFRESLVQPALDGRERGGAGPLVVLGAHNHMNMHVELEGADYVTASSLSEVPFECKLFEVSAGQVTMSTHSLGARLDFESQYDYDRTYVQGRPIDRAFSRATA